MASSSSASVTSPLGTPVFEKLTRENFLLWKAQFLPPIRRALLLRILDGSKKAPSKLIKAVKEDKTKEVISNPVYEAWLAQDQQVLGYLINSIHKEVLGQVAIMTTAAEVWATLENMFSV